MPYLAMGHIHVVDDLTLNSLHTTLVFRAEDKVVACPPLSSGMTEVCFAVPTLYCCFSFPGRWKKCFFLWGHDEKISLLLLDVHAVRENLLSFI